jgi:peptidoglycan/LPS O-acetylase OafA/YrhL
MELQKPLRLSFLDSIRGIAALLVVIHHCGLGFAEQFMIVHGHLSAVHSAGDLLNYLSILGMSFGRSAVIMFFVLSGFVLTLSLKGHPSPYHVYAVRRLFRIYPTFFVVILASFAMHVYVDGPQPIGSLLSHIAMTGTKKAIHLDLAVWSLDHEMRVSLLFPLLVWGVSALRFNFVAISLVVSAACTVAIRYFTGYVAEGFNDSSFWTTWLETGYFIFFFVLGSYMALERETVSRHVASFSTFKILSLLVGFLFLLVVGDHGNRVYSSSGIDYLRSLGSVGIIGVAIGSRGVAATLNHYVLTWLGRVSYSLYLVHMPIIYFISHSFGRGISPLLGGILATAASLAIASLVSATIEFPGMRIGKTVADSLMPTGQALSPS